MATRSDRKVARRRVADDLGVHINFITSVELSASGQITVQTRGSKRPSTYKSLGDTPGDSQLTHGLIRRLYIQGGTWTSSATLERNHWLAGRFLLWLSSEHAIRDLTDTSMTPTLAWQGVLAAGPDGAGQRNLRTFLADTLPELREDGESFRDFLLGRSLIVDESRVQGYPPEVAAVIERIAVQRVGEWYGRHRQAVEEVLGELPIDWLRIDASRLVPEGAQKLPRQFTVGSHDLAAAMVLLALVDDKGPNLSTIQSYTCDSTERSGAEASFVTGVKARNRQVVKTPAPAGGLFSYGGLLEFVSGATRVERLFRNHSKDFDRLLFLATGSSRVLGTPQINAWWRSARKLAPSSEIQLPASLSFQRLRKAATLRGRLRGHNIIGQQPATARLYLADAVPDVILVPGLLGTQKSVAGYWRGRTGAVVGTLSVPETVAARPEEESGVEELARAEAIMDVGVAACISNGQSPIDESKPCGLGPVACFVCPKGYRTPETIPGLLAAVEFTDDIRKYEPEEWITGEAPLLHSLAKKALNQFPQHLVAGVQPEDIANSRAMIACVYVEGRRID